MVECDFIDALTEAERACALRVGALFGGVETYRAANPGAPDCNVFDIGRMATGATATFDARAYHWRASLELYRRDRTALQRDIMRILAALPVNADSRAEDELRETSNVIQLRVAPEDGAVSGIEARDVRHAKDEKPIPCWTATVQLDAVFLARF